MSTMRPPLAALVLAVLLVLAGCAGPGDRTPEPIEGSASRATVGDDGLSAAGYEEVTVEEDRVERRGTLDVSGDVELVVDYHVDATAQRAVYRDADADPPSVFALYSVPLVSPDQIDVRIDPLGDRSTADVAALAQGVYGEFGALEHVTNRTVSLLGSETTVANYRTTARSDGTSVDVSVYVAAVEHDGDVVRAVAVLPQADGDFDVVRTLLESTRH